MCEAEEQTVSEVAWQRHESGDVEGAIAELSQAIDDPETPDSWRTYYRVSVATWQHELGLKRDTLATIEAVMRELPNLESRPKTRLRWTANMLAIRGQIYLDWGLVDLAARCFELEREAVAAMPAAGVDDASHYRRQANRHLANLALAQQDIDALDDLVRRAEADHETYDANPGEVSRLRIRRALLWNELERADPSRPRRARAALEDELEHEGDPREWILPKLTLVEIAIREGGFDAARAVLEEIEPALELGRTASGDRYDIFATMTGRLALNRGDQGEAGDQALAVLEQGFEGMLQRWRESELRAGGYGILWHGPSTAMLSEVIRARMHEAPGEAGVEAALLAVSRVAALGSLARRRGATPPELDRIRDALIGDDPRHAVLLYLPSPLRGHLFVVTRDALEHHPLEMEDHLVPACERMTDELSTPLDDPSGEARRRERREAATRLLLGPIRDRLDGWERLTVVGLDLLAGVPFDALVGPSGGPLWRTHSICSVPSLPIAVAIAEQASPDVERDQVWLLGAARPAEVEGRAPPPDLPLDGQTARSLLAPYDLERESFFGAAATADPLASQRAGRVLLLQLLVHGTTIPDEERDVALVLTPSRGDGGLLRASTVEGWSSVPPTVLLTACWSGAGPRRRGDAGASDVGGAFLGMGSSCVLLSDFPLDYHATVRLSQVFHREAAAGASPSSALRRARVELAEDPRFGDLFYTSHLRVIGAGHRPIVAPRTPRRPFAACAVAVVLIGAALLTRRRVAS